jgi:PAS domain S-box-containing protein
MELLMGLSPRVLHVDDEPGFSDLLESVLIDETHDGTVIAASSAEEALEKLASEEIDCIVSDYDMPKKNGLEFLMDVREQYPNLPFILFTGKGSESIASEAITAGVTDYLQKGGGIEHYELLVNRIIHAVNQYQAQHELRETTEYYSTILSHTSDYIMIVDEFGEVQYVSPAIDRIMGYSPAEITGTNAFDLVHPDDMETAGGTFERVVSTPAQEFVEEFRAEHKDGSSVWLEVRGKNLIENPVIDGILVDARDITTRKEYEENLGVLTESLPALFLSSSESEILDTGRDIASQLVPDASFDFYFVESNGHLVLASSSTQKTHEGTEIPLDEAPMLKEAIDSAVTRRLDLRKEDAGYLASTLSAASAIVIPVEARGILLLTHETCTVIGDEQVSLLELLSSNLSAALEFLDWKDRVETREEMVAAQNKRLQEFASIVSHDLRNPLNIAQGRLELARKEVTSDHLEAVAEAHTRMITLIDNLLGLAKHGDAVLDPEPVDLKRIARLAWEDTRSDDIELVIDDTVTTFAADAPQLQQLFANLFQNAIEHGKDVSTIRIGQLSDGFFVEDDGVGISPSEREAVFRTGYSTTLDGTGYGLRIVEFVATAHNWEVHLTSGRNGGARFEFTAN